MPGDPAPHEPIVVVPYGGHETTLARRVESLAWVWAIAAIILAVALRAGPLILVALAPIVYLRIPPSILRRLPGGHRLVAASPYRVELDRDGLTFGDPTGSPHRVPWDEVERMEADGWGWGRLIARDGSMIAQVNPAYVRLQGSWLRSPSLAVFAVRMRPDLFVPSTSVNRFTQPYGFQRPTPGHRPPDLAAIDRRQVILQVLFVGALLAIVVGVFVLFPNGGSVR